LKQYLLCGDQSEQREGTLALIEALLSNEFDRLLTSKESQQIQELLKVLKEKPSGDDETLDERWENNAYTEVLQDGMLDRFARK
jgi:hypothetical protein